MQANQWQLLKAIGVLEDDRTAIGRKGRGRALRMDPEVVDDATGADPPGSLGAKLADLGRELTQVGTEVGNLDMFHSLFHWGQSWQKSCQLAKELTQGCGGQSWPELWPEGGG